MRRNFKKNVEIMYSAEALLSLRPASSASGNKNVWHQKNIVSNSKVLKGLLHAPHTSLVQLWSTDGNGGFVQKQP